MTTPSIAVPTNFYAARADADNRSYDVTIDAGTMRGKSVAGMHVPVTASGLSDANAKALAWCKKNGIEGVKTGSITRSGRADSEQSIPVKLDSAVAAADRARGDAEPKTDREWKEAIRALYSRGQDAKGWALEEKYKTWKSEQEDRADSDETKLADLKRRWSYCQDNKSGLALSLQDDIEKLKRKMREG